MAGITSGVGLITGLPIEDTVNQLMSISARPRNILASRTEGLQSERLAIDSLASQLLSLKFSSNSLNLDTTYTSRKATSSNKDALTVAIPSGKTPTPGSFSVLPARTASAQQLVSSRFDDATADIGSGEFSFRVGGFVDKGVSLDQLNSGVGVHRGSIKITDRSGATAEIDLSLALTTDDVLNAINAATAISVQASTSGDRFTLTDGTAGTGALIVQEVAGGSTAADLGLAGINTTDATATGFDVLTLHLHTRLADLNDGNGVYLSGTGVDDLDISLSDGTNAGVDLSGSKTLGDIIKAINDDEDLIGKLTAQISADGNRLELNDLTTGSQEFSVAAGVAGTAAADLGLLGAPLGSTLTGDRLAGGLRDTLLANLKGGAGIGPLGEITITDRAGVDAQVDLSAAETLGDVVELINAASVGVKAAVNNARNGIVVTDESGGVSALIVESSDATNSAEELGIAINDAKGSVDSGSLRRQNLSLAAQLSSLNGAKPFKLGDIRLTDANGKTAVADLNALNNEAQTVGDVIEAINGLDLAVEARLNDAGDGVLIVSTADAGAEGALTVQDVNGTVAADLHLTRKSETIEIEGTPTQVIDGTSTYSVDLSELGQPTSGRDTLLSSLNNGAGLSRGDFVITDSTGNRSVALDLNGGDAGIATIGQLIDAINERASDGLVGVKARLNTAGTGILLEDTAAGTGKLTVRDVSGSSASELKIAGTAKIKSGKQTIDGAGAFTAASAATSGIEAVAARINELEAGVTAAALFDGVGYRLSLTVEKSGAANQLLIDGAAAGLEFKEVAKAQDALLAYGGISAADGILVSSPTNEFKQVLGGVDLTVVKPSDAPATVSVTDDDAPLLKKAQELVDAYNAIRKTLGEQTDFNAEENTTGILFGTHAVLQVDTRLASVFTGRYSGAGRLRSLEQVGISANADGTLTLDKTQLAETFADDPDAVRDLFTNKQTGLVARLNGEIDRLAANDNSVLVSRGKTLQDTIDANNERLELFTLQLDKERARITAQFTQLEAIVARLQDSQNALNNLQPIPPLRA